MFKFSKKQFLFLSIFPMIGCLGFITIAVLSDMMFGAIFFSFLLGADVLAFFVILLRKNGEHEKNMTKEVN